MHQLDGLSKEMPVSMHHHHHHKTTGTPSSASESMPRASVILPSLKPCQETQDHVVYHSSLPDNQSCHFLPQISGVRVQQLFEEPMRDRSPHSATNNLYYGGKQWRTSSQEMDHLPAITSYMTGLSNTQSRTEPPLDIRQST